MKTIFEIKGRKGGAKKIEINEIGELCWIDYQKNAKLGDTIVYEKVLKHEEEYGQPYLKNRQVVAKVIVESELNKKFVVAKYKSKKRYKVKKGGRQQYTLIKIVGIESTEQHALSGN